MRRLLAAFFALAVFFFAVPVFAYTSPGKPTGYVNDFSGALSTETKQSLESELSAFEASTTNEISVAIVPNLGGDYIENYAVKLFEEWGVGKRDHDNGVLLVVAMQEHKLRIEVGYGLEGALPDSLAQRILDNEMTPSMRASDVDGAVTAAVHAIEAATQGEYVATGTSPFANIPSWILENIWFIIFVPIFIFQWLASILARSRSWWAGGVVGVVAAGIIAMIAPLGLTLALILVGIFGGFGLLFDFMVSRAYHSSRNSGTTPPWWAGGSSIGGSSGGGSFGGFGGGSSGGGGASGSW